MTTPATLMLPKDTQYSASAAADFRWLRKADGTRVLQQAMTVYWSSGKRTYEWHDVPTVEADATSSPTDSENAK